MPAKSAGLAASGFLLSLCAALLLGSCSTTDNAPDHPGASSSLIYDLEQRLLEARWIHFAFEIEARGALHAELTGNVWLGRDGESRLTWSGWFAGREYNIDLISDGSVLRELGDSKATRACPPDLHAAYVLGFTRMGLLHNIAVSTAGRAPDHGNGGVEEWVVLRRIRQGPTPSDTAFDVLVGGRQSAEAELRLETNEEMIPRIRHQKVDFGSGRIMNVVERYSQFTLSRSPSPQLFSSR